MVFAASLMNYLVQNGGMSRKNGLPTLGFWVTEEMSVVP